MRPLVSVVIPAFNASSFIARTLQSCLSQTYGELEIIVVNDGSTDDTAAIVSSFARADERLHLFSKPREGLAAARNDGIARASGQYIAFIDADDLWHASKIEKQMQLLQSREAQGYAAVYCLYRSIGLDDEVFEDAPDWGAEGSVHERQNYWNFVGNGSNLLCRTLVAREVGGFDRSLVSNGMVADWYFQIKIASNYNVALVRQYLVGYRKYPGSMSTNRLAYARARRDLLTRQRHFAVSPECKAWMAGDTYSTSAHAYYKTSHFGLALWMVFRTLVEDPARVANAAIVKAFQRGFRKSRSSDVYAGSNPYFYDLDVSVGYPPPIPHMLAARLRHLRENDERRVSKNPILSLGRQAVDSGS